MALKVELKPGERIIVGESLITNADGRAVLLIAGNAPILREKDVLTAEDATTPAKRIYLCIQMMYLENNISKYKDIFIELTKDIVLAAPSFIPFLEKINNLILKESLYKALKESRKILKHEEELLKNV